jgi:hypothetical protein
MLKHFVAVAAFTACFAAPAFAQEGWPPPVETMTCDQMTAEMMVAGQQMNSQLDPEFAREAQAMHDEAQSGQRQGVAVGVGTGIACSIPGVGMACMAAQQAQAVNAGRQAEANRQRHAAQVDRLNNSMAGLDQQRLMAVSQRFEQLGCQTPQ